MSEEEITFLNRVPGFDSTDDQGKKIISQCVQRFGFPKGSYLMASGEQGDRMFIIAKGIVEILQEDERGKQTLIARLGSGDIVGEMALLTARPRVADAVAVENVIAYGIRRADLEPLLRQTPSLARFLSELLGRRLEEGVGIKEVGKYRLAGLLGQGGSSKVFAGVHPGLNRVVAVKMLSHSLAYDEQFRQRFLNEARTIASLNHPNIIQVFDMEEDFATFFIVMEQITGKDLATVLIEEGPMDPSKAMSILGQVGQALQFAHDRGIVHRDVKPGNCAIDESGMVKLMDFGIADRIEPDGEVTRKTVVEGTPHYLSPEAAVGRAVDGRADIYALGIMGFRMLTGQHPFNATSPQDILRAHVRQQPPNIEDLRPELPSGVIDFVKGALLKDPKERLSDWSQIFDLLETDVGRRSHIPKRYRERILRIRYPQGSEALVEEASQKLKRAVALQEDITVAWGDLIEKP